MNQILRLLIFDLTGQNGGLPYIIYGAAPTPTPVVADTHDGGRRKKRKEEDLDAYRQKNELRRQMIADAVDPPAMVTDTIKREPVPQFLKPVKKSKVRKDDAFERFMRDLEEDETMLMML